MLVANAVPNEVQELFDTYSAKDIIGFLNQFDLFLVNEGVRRKMSVDFEKQYALVMYLLKESLPSIEPPRSGLN